MKNDIPGLEDTCLEDDEKDHPSPESLPDNDGEEPIDDKEEEGESEWESSCDLSSNITSCESPPRPFNAFESESESESEKELHYTLIDWCSLI